MKFDFCIGNPPYQGEADNNGRKPPVYHLFVDAAYDIANTVELITPARFLFDAGQTPKEWNQKMLTDDHFKVLKYEPDAELVFANTEIKGGVAISIRNKNKLYGAIKVFTKYPELNDIVQRVCSNNNNHYLDEIISPRGTYRLSEKFFVDFPFASERLGKGTGNMIASNFFEKIPEAWSEKPKSDCETIGMLSRINSQRKYCFIKREYIKFNNFIDGYNVASPKSNGNGDFGEILTATEIINPKCGSTDTFINIGSFVTKGEAESLTKFIKSKFLRTLLGVRKVTQDNSRDMWSMIPLQDFTEKSDIDWTKPVHEIDLQLYKKYGLTDDEITFIETHVKEMA